MRKAIRLTGRRQLPKADFDFRLIDQKGKHTAALSVINRDCLKGFPVDAEIRLRLVENKQVEILKFGTVGKPLPVIDVKSSNFAAPSCQVRVVNTTGNRDGLLLGSTKPWTYTSNGRPEGLLLFQPKDIAPRLWRLDLRDDENPILYVDERIQDAGQWAMSDPVFTAAIFPHVISEVMQFILRTGSEPEDGWMADWLAWVETLKPGSKLPFTGDDKARREWIEDLIDSFAYRHKLSDSVVAAVKEAGDE